MSGEEILLGVPRPSKVQMIPLVYYMVLFFCLIFFGGFIFLFVRNIKTNKKMRLTVLSTILIFVVTFCLSLNMLDGTYRYPGINTFIFDILDIIYVLFVVMIGFKKGVKDKKKYVCLYLLPFAFYIVMNMVDIVFSVAGGLGSSGLKLICENVILYFRCLTITLLQYNLLINYISQDFEKKE